MDISLEVINAIKSRVNLHILIEVTPNSRNANIMNLTSLPADKIIVSADELLDQQQLSLFKNYFDGCQSVNFVLFAEKEKSVAAILGVGRAVRKLIRKYNPTVLHFESFSVRTLPLLPLIFGERKIVYSIHDGQLHSGEKNWKDRLARFLFLGLGKRKAFVFYSEFTKNQFLNGRNMAKVQCQKIQIQKYSFWKKLHDRFPSSARYILFFGRISKYKGVPALLDAMSEVWVQFPDVALIIAGRGHVPEVANHSLVIKKDNRIRFVNRHIQNDELAKFISDAMVVVCPYTDASQSGVLWTAFGLDKPVVATNVGAFKEFIRPGFNGFLIEEVSPKSIAKALVGCLTGNKFLELEENLKNAPYDETIGKNGEMLLKLYQ